MSYTTTVTNKDGTVTFLTFTNAWCAKKANYQFTKASLRAEQALMAASIARADKAIKRLERAFPPKVAP